MIEPKELFEYKTDHDLIIELSTLVRVMNAKLDTFTTLYVTKSEFWPVKTLVYGCTALMLTSLVGAILFLVLKR